MIEVCDTDRLLMNNRYWNSFLPVFLDRIGNIMRNHMSEYVKKYDISGAHCLYLISLNLLDGPTSSQLSYFLDMDRGNTFRVIKALIEKGLITADKKTENSRKYRLYLTPVGKEIADGVMTDTAQFMDDSLSDIPDEDLENMRNTLIRILERIDPGIDDYLQAKEYANPYFSYLNVIVPNDDGVVMAPRRLYKEEDAKKSGYKTSALAGNAPTFPNTSRILSDSGKNKLTVLIRRDGSDYVYDVFQNSIRTNYTSGRFKTTEECRANVNLIKANCNANVRDRTSGAEDVRDFLPCYNILDSGNGKFHFELVSSEKEILITSDDFDTKEELKDEILTFIISMPFVSVVEI